MRLIFIVVTFISISSSHALATSAFKTSAPRTWKLLDKVDDNRMVYVNTSSNQNERIILQSADVIAETAEFQSHLDEKKAELTQVRANFFSKMGMSGYTVLNIENRKSNSRQVPVYQAIESRFRNLTYKEVQMVERQYLYRSKLYTITYTVESRAISNHARVEASLDYFQPVLRDSRRPASDDSSNDSGDDTGSSSATDESVSAESAPSQPTRSPASDAVATKTSDAVATESNEPSHDGQLETDRAPASERDPANVAETARAAGGARVVAPKVTATTAGASTLTSPATETDTALTTSAVSDLDMANSANKAMCQGVPEAKRRKPSDPGFVNAFDGVLGDGWGCLMGVKDNLWGMVTSTAQMAWDIGKYAFSSSYRDQTNSTVGVIYSEIKKSPKEFAKRVGSEIWNTAAKAVGDFKCMNTQEQVREVCNLATNFLPGGILLKVVTKAPLAVADAAKVTTMVRAAMGFDKTAVAAADAEKSAEAIAAAAKVAKPGADTDAAATASSKIANAEKPARTEARSTTTAATAANDNTHATAVSVAANDNTRARSGAERAKTGPPQASTAEAAPSTASAASTGAGPTQVVTPKTPTLRSMKAADQKELSDVLTRIDQKQANRLDRALQSGGKAAKSDLKEIIAKNKSEDFSRALKDHEFTGNAKTDSTWMQKTMHDLAKAERDASDARPIATGARAADQVGSDAAIAARSGRRAEALDRTTGAGTRDASALARRDGTAASTGAEAGARPTARASEPGPARGADAIAGRDQQAAVAVAANDNRDTKMLQQISRNPKGYQGVRTQILSDPKLSLPEKSTQLKLADAANARLSQIQAEYGDLFKAKQVAPNDSEVMSLIADLEKQGVPRRKIREALDKIDPSVCAIPR